MNNSFLENGYIIKEQIISSIIVNKLFNVLDEENINNFRNIHHKIPLIKEIAHSQDIIKHIRKYFDSKPQLVRCLYFNKTPNCNWNVPWHQDKTIAVQEKIKLSGFSAWSRKQGIIHVQPPAEIMENIVTVRLHLDKTNQENGALKVIPKTHQLGILSSTEINTIKQNNSSVVCQAKAGDALIMKPLILHSSSKAIIPTNRRIIHWEYASIKLPSGLQWIDR